VFLQTEGGQNMTFFKCQENPEVASPQFTLGCGETTDLAGYCPKVILHSELFLSGEQGMSPGSFSFTRECEKSLTGESGITGVCHITASEEAFLKASQRRQNSFP